MNPATLQRVLPEFRNDVDISVAGNQTGNDIVNEVMTAHDLYARDYDAIADYFYTGNSADTLRKIFNFLRRHVPYAEEPGKLQTVKSPAAILALSKPEVMGNDCKHYANFAGGVLAAINRAHPNNKIPFVYRFASYDDDPLPTHVYIVADGDTWIDPAPLKVSKYDSKKRTFDDRLIVPTFFTDIKPRNMIARISGVNYFIDDDSDPAELTDPGCGCPQALGDITLPASLTSTVSTLNQATAIQQGATQLAQFLPDGNLKDWLNGFFQNPTKKLAELFLGKAYPTNWYALGERYMRNILGMIEIQRRGQVPDNYVPQAGVFWSAALGVRIQADDHLEALSRSADDYIRLVQTFGYEKGVPRANIDRAARILKKINWLGYYLTDAGRNVRLPLNDFRAEPYLYPIPSAAVDDYFEGVHPITGVQLRQGMPVAGSSEQLPSGVTDPNALPPDYYDPSRFDNSKPSTGKLLLYGALAVGGIYAVSKISKSRARNRKRKKR